MNKRTFLMIIVVLVLTIVLAACSGINNTPTVSDPGQIEDGLPPLAAVKAREALAEKMDINIDKISIISHDQAIWSDSCLGLGGAAESCLQAEVEGWLVELSVEGGTHKIRTDWLGEQVRFEP